MTENKNKTARTGNRFSTLRTFRTALSSATLPAILLTLAASLLPAQANADLVAHYKLDDGSGTVAVDSAGGDQDANQNQGTVTWTATGLIGGALDLDGFSSLQALDALSPADTAFTMSAWVNPNTDGGYKGIYAGRNTPGNWGLNIESGHGDFRFSTIGASHGVDSPDNSVVESGGWYHMAITWEGDGVNKTGIAYLNGVPIGSAPGHITAVYASPDGFYNIGDDPCCGNREFNGQIDDIAVWNEALTEAQIMTVYEGGLAGIDAPTSLFGGLPSDLNSNGFVDFEDLTILLANWNKDVTADDGNLVEPLTTVVNFADLTVLLADWTGPGPAGSPEAALGEAVPEPSSLLLAVLATLGLSFGWRRRRRAF